MIDAEKVGLQIQTLRKQKNITQSDLGEMLGVTFQSVSKWENGKGYPDITLMEPLANILGVSVLELLSGDLVTNENRSFNMKRSVFYVCPLCGNIIASAGKALVCCCGVTLPPLEAEREDEEHKIEIGKVEDEYYVTLNHQMTREHYISFIAAVRDNDIEITKLYPEGPAEARFKIGRVQMLYAYCNRHGLFKVNIK